ncbi:DNA internalization-related competence protein ComEC/Rec2 [Vallitalea pronyensis]|uniref:DNA internalization-related competence protein ComEC/Rec2 n=1 Tax=Vallitalea pronyensis TaxID=1348613 RepID=A0A8J8MLD6_9FIRM|nr:DNA internalization-related competence protein ComEC/Rec2 [Vallitalea pronyensis]QUI23885.1 DNA internalization-related competence protein ComEC/Rec2 [Vallitalea pronyensis]
MKRPAMWMIGYYLIGLWVGYTVKDWYISIGIFAIMTCVSVLLYKTYYWKPIILFPLICFFAYLHINGHVKSYEYPGDMASFNSVESQLVGTIQDMAIEAGEGHLLLDVSEITVGNKTYKKNLRIKVYGSGLQDVSIGHRVRVTGKLIKLWPSENPGGFNEKLYYNIRGIHYKCYMKSYQLEDDGAGYISRIPYTIRRGLYNLRYRATTIYERLLPHEEAQLMKAMLLGDKSGMTRETKDQFTKAGIAHVLAISGLHVGIIGYGLFHLMTCFIAKKRALWLTVLFLVFYCMLTGGSISTVRASFMLIVGLMAYLFGRNYDVYSSLAIAAMVLLIINPLYLWDIGFLLSFSSVIGIVTCLPALNGLYNKKNNSIISLVNVSIGATLGTLPVILYNYYEIQLYGIGVNLLVVPLMTIVVLMGFLALLLGSISMIFGKLCIGIVYYIFMLYDVITQWVGELPYHTVTIGRPSWPHLICIIICIVLIAMIKNPKITWRQWKKYMYANAIFFGIVTLILSIQPRPLQMTHLAIGQGDSTVIITPSKHAFVVDGGGNRKKDPLAPDTGYYTVRPFLKYHGISHIESIVMTHSDQDHVGGLIELMDYFTVKRLIVPYGYKDKKDEDMLLNKLLAKASQKHVPISYMQTGDVLDVGEVSMEAIYPTKNTQRYKNNNAYSLVLAIDYRGFRSLLTGDIEEEAEELLHQKLADSLQSDIIKVPHHGSRTSSSEKFVHHVNPAIAIISAGRDNVYGHPHQDIIDRYKELGVSLYHTAEDGAVMIKTDGYHMGIRTHMTKREDYYPLALHIKKK